MIGRRDLLAGALAPAAAAARRRPNVIFILCDDIGYSDPGYGGPYPSLRLDRLARSSPPPRQFARRRG
jgi:hypothetical protein